MSKPSKGRMRYDTRRGALFVGKKQVANLVATWSTDTETDCPDAERNANGRRIARAWNALNKTERLKEKSCG